MGFRFLERYEILEDYSFLMLSLTHLISKVNSDLYNVSSCTSDLTAKYSSKEDNYSRYYVTLMLLLHSLACQETVTLQALTHSLSSTYQHSTVLPISQVLFNIKSKIFTFRFYPQFSEKQNGS
jgi:hypothetical protein